MRPDGSDARCDPFLTEKPSRGKSPAGDPRLSRAFSYAKLKAGTRVDKQTKDKNQQDMKKSNRKETLGRDETAPLRTCLLLAMALMSQSRLATAAETPVALGRAGSFAVLAGSTVT